MRIILRHSAIATQDGTRIEVHCSVPFTSTHDANDHPRHLQGCTEQAYNKTTIWCQWTILSRTLVQLLAASRMSTARSFPRPLGCVLVNHLLHLNNQLPILR